MLDTGSHMSSIPGSTSIQKMTGNSGGTLRQKEANTDRQTDRQSLTVIPIQFQKFNYIFWQKCSKSQKVAVSITISSQ